jgi:hypothetical protein
VQNRELAGLQNTYQRQQQQQAHDFRMLEQTHGTDEALRLEQQKQLQQLQIQQKAVDTLKQVGQDGQTTEQNQFAINQVGDVAAPGQRKEGFDWVVRNGNLIGQVPQRGTVERAKIELTGNSYSNIADMATKKLWQLQNGQVPSVAEWNTEVNAAMMDFRRITDAGAMQQADINFYEKLLPSLSIMKGEALTADVLGRKREQLRALKNYTERGLQQYAASTLIPVETYTADDWRVPDNFRPTKPPPQDEFNKGRTEREQRLQELGARNERRVRPAIEYEKKSSAGPGLSLPQSTGRSPRAYTVP